MFVGDVLSPDEIPIGAEYAQKRSEVAQWFAVTMPQWLPVWLFAWAPRREAGR